MRLLREDGQIPPLTLKLVSPSEEGLKREIDLRALFEDNGGKEVVRVGRHPANDIVLDSLRIPLLLSRFHARIELKRDDGVIVISDANTTNGTYVRSFLCWCMPEFKCFTCFSCCAQYASVYFELDFGQTWPPRR